LGAGGGCDGSHRRAKPSENIVCPIAATDTFHSPAFVTKPSPALNQRWCQWREALSDDDTVLGEKGVDRLAGREHNGSGSACLRAADAAHELIAVRGF